MPYVTVHVDAEEVLDELSDEELREELHRREKKAGSEPPDEFAEARFLEAVWMYFRGREDTPPEIRDYLWERLGKIV